MIPYGRQSINVEDIDAVVSVLKSDFLTQGPTIPKFEAAVADKVRAKFGVAANSATSALHIAVSALGAGPGDIVWTSPITFVASANCARYCGAEVDFVDIDPDTYNMCPDALEKKLQAAQDSGRLPKIIIPVHMCGQSPNMKRIAALAGRHGIKIVEDASHAVGAQFLNQPVGSCLFSDITVFSFHPVKIITTAEGGIALTNEAALADRMQSLRSHGITRNPEDMTHTPDGTWYYQQLELGFNYRMTELQAALGLSQLSRLEQFVEKRNQLAKRYDTLLQDLPIRLPVLRDDVYSAFHLYIIQLINVSPYSRRAVFEAMKEQGVGVNVHYIPVHLQPYYMELGFALGDYPNSELYYRQAITLPLYPGMTKEDQDTIVDALKETLSKCRL